ncbi:hypothetical protein [Kaistella polysaccharea]|uniref:hypothetical protein n=1 Tax=Kaistella polysaccharea TaxID=2878534 RepID=UPI001CF40089|nr:hypothetical protein [Kaistella polysaccharea]
MRLNNRNKAGYFQFLSILVAMILAGGIIAFFLERNFYDLMDSSAILLLIVPLIIALIFYLRGNQIFEYDSDGEALHFRSKNVVFFLDKTTNDEFPKYKLLNYEIVNMLFLKRLYITISSKKNKSMILKYDISYLSGKELADLNSSLKNVLHNNKE